MASTGDEGPLDTAMEQDEDVAQEKVDHPKATYKSFKYVAIKGCASVRGDHTSFVQTNTLPTAQLTCHSLGRSIGR
jgi:hypothetical protein